MLSSIFAVESLSAYIAIANYNQQLDKNFRVAAQKNCMNMNENYKRQVALLITIMPSVYKITAFAVHGGTARTVSFSQLYGSKIAAALSRQHPRDLFQLREIISRQKVG